MSHVMCAKTSFAYSVWSPWGSKRDKPICGSDAKYIICRIEKSHEIIDYTGPLQSTLEHLSKRDHPLLPRWLLYLDRPGLKSRLFPLQAGNPKKGIAALWVLVFIYLLFRMWWGWELTYTQAWKSSFNRINDILLSFYFLTFANYRELVATP